MKKSGLFLSVLVAVLVLGVAYASFTREFVVTGTASSATADGSAFEVLVTDIAYEQTVGTGATVNSSVGDGLKNNVTYTATGLKEVGDTVKFTITVTNNSEDLNALITGFTTTTSGDTGYFSVYGTKDVKDSDVVLSDNNLAPGETATFTVFVTLEQNTVAEGGKTITISTVFQADPADA